MTYEDRMHTCGRCQYENVPDEEYPCNKCVWSKDIRQDLWTPKKSEEVDKNDGIGDSQRSHSDAS